MVDQRRSPRAAVALECTLMRRNGNPVQARTQDLGAGGMRVVTERPLSVDEELSFELTAPVDRHRDGRAWVVREQGLRCYALRFDAAVDDMLAWVGYSATT